MTAYERANYARPPRGALGYWRLAQTKDGVWWFIDPQGNREFLNSVQTIRPMALSRDPKGPHYISKDYLGEVPESAKSATTDIFPDDYREKNAQPLDYWGKQAAHLTLDIGFKSAGAWNDEAIFKTGLPFTKDLNLLTWLPIDHKSMDDPRWLATIENAVREQVEPLQNNKNLVGFYLENEHYWNDWTEAQMRRYYQLVTRLVHKYDKNHHLILGVRYQGIAPDAAIMASAGLTDAQSVNLYPADAKLDPDLIKRIHEKSGGQPIIITEFAQHYVDEPHGYLNDTGYFAQVADAKTRAEAYKSFMRGISHVPYIVGADWFQWADQPPGGRKGDGEAMNWGIVDIGGIPHSEMVAAVSSTRPRLNLAHLGSATFKGTSIWRKPASLTRSTGTLARMQNSKLDCRIDLDSEWPAESELPMTPTDIFKFPANKASEKTPRTYVAASQEGITIAAEVFEGKPLPAGSKNWWGTHPIDISISTHANGPADRLDDQSYRFFFMPNSVAKIAADPSAPLGKVGMYVPGKNMVYPDQKLLRSSSCDTGKGSYIVEIFVPKSMLNHYDLQVPIAYSVNVQYTRSGEEFAWGSHLTDGNRNPGNWGILSPSTPTGKVTPVEPAPTTLEPAN